MSNVHCQQVETPPAQAEALLAGVLAAAKAAFPEGDGRQGLDRLVWGAARLGDQATLRYLLANGGGSSWTPPEDYDDGWGRWAGKCCLWVASRNGHEGAVKELLESGVDVDRVQGGEDDEVNFGFTPLCIAAEKGHEGVMEQLLKAGADVNKTSENVMGASPLCIAAENGREGMVELLLKAGADVNNKAPANDDEGLTPLLLSARSGHEGVVERLLKAGADVNETVEDNVDVGPTALYNAAQNGHQGVVEQLLKAGADVKNCTAFDGSTPLHISAERGHQGVVEQLLKAGADPNAKTKTNRRRSSSNTPLRNAVLHGHREVALVLMEHGASSGDAALPEPLLQDLNTWMAEALRENKKQMEQMVHGIAEWCAQASSSAAAEGVNSPDPPQPDASVGSKRKAPSAGS